MPSAVVWEKQSENLCGCVCCFVGRNPSPGKLESPRMRVWGKGEKVYLYEIQVRQDGSGVRRIEDVQRRT